MKQNLNDSRSSFSSTRWARLVSLWILKTGNRITRDRKQNLPPEADLVHQLLYLSGHVSDLVSCQLLHKSFSLLYEETEDEAESVVKSLHVEDLLGDQDVLEAPVLVLGRLDVEVPGLARGLNHLNRK